VGSRIEQTRALLRRPPQAWEGVAEVAALWDRLGRDDPLVRRAVAGYLTACPLASAKRHAAAVAATGLTPRAAD
jgi:hypothetical protein